MKAKRVPGRRHPKLQTWCVLKRASRPVSPAGCAETSSLLPSAHSCPQKGDGPLQSITPLTASRTLLFPISQFTELKTEAQKG